MENEELNVQTEVEEIIETPVEEVKQEESTEDEGICLSCEA